VKNEQFDVGAAAHRVRALVRSRRFVEAIELSERNIASWPISIRDQAWHDLAYTFWCAGRTQDAMTAVTTAIELNSRDAAHRDARARWALEMRDFKTTIEDCTSLLEIEMARKSEAFVDAARVLRGFALLQIGTKEEARNDLTAVHGSGPFRIWKRDWTMTELLSLTRSV
jgi:tetratricopeptide (TPR) repeat protein